MSQLLWFNAYRLTQTEIYQAKAIYGIYQSLFQLPFTYNLISFAATKSTDSPPSFFTQHFAFPVRIPFLSTSHICQAGVRETAHWLWQWLILDIYVRTYMCVCVCVASLFRSSEAAAARRSYSLWGSHLLSKLTPSRATTPSLPPLPPPLDTLSWLSRCLRTRTLRSARMGGIRYFFFEVWGVSYQCTCWEVSIKVDD